MAASIAPYSFTEELVEMPMKAEFEMASTRLQLVLLSIFQLLRLKCSIPLIAVEDDFQEAVRLVSELKILGAALEQQNFSTDENALKRQLANMKTEFEITTQENKYLKGVVVHKETSRAAAAMERNKLERLVESLKSELDSLKKKKPEITDEISLIIEGGIEKQNYTDKNILEKPVTVLELLKKDLEAQNKLFRECTTENSKLQKHISNVEKQHAALLEKILLREISLNSTELNTSISDKIDVIEKGLIKKHDDFKKNLRDLKKALDIQITLPNCTFPDRWYYITRDKLNHTIGRLEHLVTLYHNSLSKLPLLSAGKKVGNSSLRLILKGRTREQALMEEVKKGNSEAVGALLEHNVDPNICDTQGMSPLHWSAQKGHLLVAEILLQYNHMVDINRRVKGCSDLTPLHLAASAGNTEIARLLLDLGADINAQTNDGSSPLHLAAKEGKIDMVQTLMSRGANINLANNTGCTPKGIAESNKYYAIAHMLSE